LFAAQAGAEVLIVGHTHDAFNLATEKGRIINPGACWSKTHGQEYATESLQTPCGL